VSGLITAVDHVPIVVRDLDAAVAAYSTLLGRAPSWEGKLGPGIRNAWFQLANIALHLIGADGEGPESDGVRARLERHGEGPYGIAWRALDFDETVRRLERRSIPIRETGVTRSVTADGQVHEWRFAAASPGATRGLPMFVIERRPDVPPLAISPAIANEADAIAAVDHIVVRSQDADGAVALYGGRLGLDLRLDRANEAWGARQMFFACADMVVEIGSPFAPDPGRAGERDSLGGLAWRVSDPHAAQARLAAAGIDVSEVRKGRKPGTEVFTVKARVPGAPYLMIKASGADRP